MVHDSRYLAYSYGLIPNANQNATYAELASAWFYQYSFLTDKQKADADADFRRGYTTAYQPRPYEAPPIAA